MTSITKINLKLRQLSTLIDERHRLVRLSLHPSETDDSDLVLLLKDILSDLKSLDNNLINTNNISTKQFQKQQISFDNIIHKYKNLLKDIKDDETISIKPYTFEKSIIVDSSPKTVRFKESLIDPPSNSNSNTTSPPPLYDSANPFQPYKDDPEDLMANRSYSDSLASSQTELLPIRNMPSPAPSLPEIRNSNDLNSISQQQQLTIQEQDSHLDSLSNSISIQRQLGLTINNELDDQNVMLHDIEDLTINSDSRLIKAKKNLQTFSTRAKENGSWLTIGILFLILIILLVVLK